MTKLPVCFLALIVASSFEGRASEAAAVDPSKLPPVASAFDFVQDIKPLLEQSCLKCHGEEKQKGGLRVDSRDALLAGGDSGAAVVEAKSAESRLIHHTARIDEEEAMPPKKENALTAEQVGKLRAWIDAGLPFPAPLAYSKEKKAPTHWSFVPPVKASLPDVKNAAWSQAPLDRFILARLEKEGLQPSPETPRATLLRRVSLDLTGLAPTLTEIDAFEKDAAPDAYEKHVGRLLDSPRYGERWARWWLDAARYADSDGYEKDLPREQHAWRDWVIHAFNRDLPWDKFIVAQIAGDQLPGAGQDERIATGFIRNTMVNEEGAVIPEQFRLEGMFDRMEALGKGVLGLTVQCAQCHTHKFDPITQEEYFKMFAFLNNVHEAISAIYTPPQLMEIEGITRELATVDQGIKEQIPDWSQKAETWTRSLPAEIAWTPLRPTSIVEAVGLVHPTVLSDDSVLCLGHKMPDNATLTTFADLPADRPLTGLRIEALTHGDLPFGGPGRSFKGLFGISEVKVDTATAAEPEKWTSVALQNATSDFAQPESPIDQFFRDGDDKRLIGPAAFLIDGKEETAWGVDRGPGRRNRDLEAVLQFSQPLTAAVGTKVRITFKFSHMGKDGFARRNNGIGRYRCSVTEEVAPTADLLGKAARTALSKSPDERSSLAQAEIYSAWRAAVKELTAENARVEALWQRWPETTGSVLAVYERPPEVANQTRMLQRGEWDKPGRPVAPGVPAFMHPLPENAPPTRLTFANWLVDRRSPTAARVLVNRVWQAYFGTGLVDTPEDFGTRCALPSHPELLDWLAVEFMDSGWSMKRLHRLIVLSAAYRQSSNVTPDLLERDPSNRLLARGPRFRVEAEMVRDIALQASGLLHEQVGGPSIYPKVPESLFALSFTPVDFWKTATGPERYKRGLYVFRRRSMPDPVLSSFDAPSGESSCVRRGISNTPLAALTSLNEPMFVECAQALALRTMKEGGDTEESRAAYAFRLCTGRTAKPEEIGELVKLLGLAKNRVADGWLAAREMATGDPDKMPALPPGTNPAQAAAWTVAARVLLNLDETLTKN